MLNHMVALVLIFEGFCNVIHNIHTNLYSHKQCSSVPFLHTYSKCYLLTLIKNNLTEMINLLVVQICISMMLSDVQYILLYLLVICLVLKEPLKAFFHFQLDVYAPELFQFLLYYEHRYSLLFILIIQFPNFRLFFFCVWKLLGG